MIRYLYIIIDTTKSMKEHDLKPSRIGITQIHLKNFITTFFDKNPLSMVGMAYANEGIC